MNSDELVKFKKALVEFVPFVQQLETQINVLEGKAESALAKKLNIEKETEEIIERNQILIEAEKKRSSEVLDEALKILNLAQQAYLKTVASKEVDKDLINLVKDLTDKAQNEKEKILA